jgi:hypothetical protein
MQNRAKNIPEYWGASLKTNGIYIGNVITNDFHGFRLSGQA